MTVRSNAADPADTETRKASPGVDVNEIASLEFGSDFTPFLCADVPDAEHRRALRRLWSTSELFGLRDGLDVYCGDYRTQPTEAVPESGDRNTDKGIV